MAGLTSKFVTSFSELYIRKYHFTDASGNYIEESTGNVAASASAPTAAQYRAFFGTAVGETGDLDEQISVTGSLIPLVMEIGTLSNEATVIDVPVFGDTFKGKLRGQLDGGQLDCQLYWAPRDPVHLQLREWAEDGQAVTVGIKWQPKADAADADTELVLFNSFISSFGIDTTFDDVAKASVTLVVDGKEHFIAGA